MINILKDLQIRLDAPTPWGIYFQDSATPQMDGLIELHVITMYYLVIILFSVGWIPFSVIWNFNNSKSSMSNRYFYKLIIGNKWHLIPTKKVVNILNCSTFLIYTLIPDSISIVAWYNYYVEGLVKEFSKCFWGKLVWLYKNETGYFLLAKLPTIPEETEEDLRDEADKHDQDESGNDADDEWSGSECDEDRSDCPVSDSPGPDSPGSDCPGSDSESDNRSTEGVAGSDTEVWEVVIGWLGYKIINLLSINYNKLIGNNINLESSCVLTTLINNLNILKCMAPLFYQVLIGTLILGFFFFLL